jgi:hypothetical protein
MAENKSPFDRLVELVLGLVFGCLVLQFALALVVHLLVSLWSATFRQPVVGFLAKGALVLVGLAVLIGVLVRLGHGLQGFWHGLLEQFHGPRHGRARRVRGPEHVDAPRRRRARSAHSGDPHLPLGEDE